MAGIKLLIIDNLEDGIIRLQSQLLVGKNEADFILKDNVLYNYQHGKNVHGFFKTDMEYQIVKDKAEMKQQNL